MIRLSFNHHCRPNKPVSLPTYTYAPRIRSIKQGDVIKFKLILMPFGFRPVVFLDYGQYIKYIQVPHLMKSDDRMSVVHNSSSRPYSVV